MTSYSSAYWHDPFDVQASPARRGVRFVVILGAHVGLLWAGIEFAARPEVREIATELMVRLIEPPPPEVKKELPPPKPQPARPTPPPPIMTAAPDVAAPTATFSVPPQPPAPPVVEAIPVPPTPVVTAARFDADYLSNPKPVYPTASRRLGEEGRVMLRVHVSAEGSALDVQVKHSCGFARLDEAAKAAVERWRFVPARRGTDPVDSWVAVPIVFSLQTS
jgi:periplasmic protein TonB